MKETVKPEKSKGQIFKEKKGYSKSLKRAMKRNGLTDDAANLPLYRRMRKVAKDKVRVIQKKKLENNRVYRRANPRTKKKGKQQKNVIKPA